MNQILVIVVLGLSAASLAAPSNTFVTAGYSPINGRSFSLSTFKTNPYIALTDSLVIIPPYYHQIGLGGANGEVFLLWGINIPFDSFSLSVYDAVSLELKRTTPPLSLFPQNSTLAFHSFFIDSTGQTAIFVLQSPIKQLLNEVTVVLVDTLSGQVSASFVVADVGVLSTTFYDQNAFDVTSNTLFLLGNDMGSCRYVAVDISTGKSAIVSKLSCKNSALFLQLPSYSKKLNGFIGSFGDNIHIGVLNASAAQPVTVFTSDLGADADGIGATLLPALTPDTPDVYFGIIFEGHIPGNAAIAVTVEVYSPTEVVVTPEKIENFNHVPAFLAAVTAPQEK